MNSIWHSHFFRRCSEPLYSSRHLLPPPPLRMKSIFFALLLSIVQAASGSLLRLDSVSLPLYLLGSETDPRISIESVPFATFHADPEWRFSAISKPFVPPTDRSWRPHDVNLASLYGLAVGGNSKENSKDFSVTIDASKAVRPEGYPFTVEQVIDAVVTCVKLMYPPRPSDEGILEIVITRPEKKPQQPK